MEGGGCGGEVRRGENGLRLHFLLFVRPFSCARFLTSPHLTSPHRRLKEVCGGVNTRGVRAGIPMPGHVMGSKEIEDGEIVDEALPPLLRVPLLLLLAAAAP